MSWVVRSSVCCAARLPTRPGGKTYYVNEKLGKSQFDPPAGSTIRAEPAKKKHKVATHSRELPSAHTSDKVGMMGAPRLPQRAHMLCSHAHVRTHVVSHADDALALLGLLGGEACRVVWA